MKGKVVSHIKRLEMCISGEIPDRVPVALWRHFPVDDQSPETLASAIISFQQTYDFDLVKVTPSSSYCLRDWGVEDVWKGNPEGTREYTHRVIRDPEDWTKIPILDPRKGYLGDQLKCLAIVQKELGGKAPVLQTIFNPLSQAKNLAGADLLIYHIRKYPDAVITGLNRISETTISFVEECRKLGIAGLFYAVQHAQYQLLSVSEFQQFCKVFDDKVLDHTKGFWLNMLHLHGEKVMFDQVTEYPVSIINWHDRQTPPALSEAQKIYRGVVCGGLDRWNPMTLGTPEDIYAQAKDAIAQTNGKRLILGTGCVLPVIAPHGNILAARQSVNKYS
jgi:uroporphyrinogen decarboxylase